MSKPKLESLKATYIQDGDSLNDDLQEIEIETLDAGGGIYYAIKTKRWAFDDPKELMDVINGFIAMKNE